jgi:hypothetical protein
LIKFGKERYILPRLSSRGSGKWQGKPAHLRLLKKERTLHEPQIEMLIKEN